MCFIGGGDKTVIELENAYFRWKEKVDVDPSAENVQNGETPDANVQNGETPDANVQNGDSSDKVRPFELKDLSIRVTKVIILRIYFGIIAFILILSYEGN